MRAARMCGKWKKKIKTKKSTRAPKVRAQPYSDSLGPHMCAWEERKARRDRCMYIMHNFVKKMREREAG